MFYCRTWWQNLILVNIFKTYLQFITLQYFVTTIHQNNIHALERSLFSLHGKLISILFPIAFSTLPLFTINYHCIICNDLHHAVSSTGRISILTWSSFILHFLCNKQQFVGYDTINSISDYSKVLIVSKLFNWDICNFWWPQNAFYFSLQYIIIYTLLVQRYL